VASNPKVPVLLHITHLFAYTVGGTLHRRHCWWTNQQQISKCDNGTILV